MVMYVMVAPLDLTLTTGNSVLIDLFGSQDLSDIFQPSFGIIDIGFYAIDVALGTWLGRFLVRKYYEKCNFPTTGSTVSSEGAPSDVL
jgi:hypothetical protein